MPTLHDGAMSIEHVEPIFVDSLTPASFKSFAFCNKYTHIQYTHRAYINKMNYGGCRTQHFVTGGVRSLRAYIPVRFEHRPRQQLALLLARLPGVLGGEVLRPHEDVSLDPRLVTLQPRDVFIVALLCLPRLQCGSHECAPIDRRVALHNAFCSNEKKSDITYSASCSSSILSTVINENITCC